MYKIEKKLNERPNECIHYSKESERIPFLKTKLE